MRIGFLDFEATGIDPLTARIIEYAFMLYDTELKQPLRIITNFVVIDEIISPEVTQITGITNKMVQEFGVERTAAMGRILNCFNGAEYIVAHNALNYDKPLIEKETLQHSAVVSAKWIDTMFDLPYPKTMLDRKLVHLACAHEFLNPMPHRALADVITLQKLFCKYPLEDILAINATPLLKIKADVNFNTRDLAKKRGYHWDGDKKIWTKKIREYFLAQERTAPFNVSVC